MCGIHLIVDKRGEVPPAAIAAMTASTTYRGPDFSATHAAAVQGNTYYFGHNRLCILDKSPAAHQPFFSTDKRYLLTYNGEIYNYRELREELKEDFPFRTESDTEVVLALLMKEGVAGLHKLNGMFALCFFDSLTGQLLLARDRFGIKPLYFADTDNYLVAASEIHAIFQTGLVPKKLNASQIPHYLRYKYTKAPDTFFQNIQELMPGKVLAAEPGKTATITSFLTGKIKLQNRELCENELLKRVENALLKSVKRQVVADVPVGLFLSGGTDSTLLLALLSELGHQNLPAFTISHAAVEGSFGTRDAHFGPLAARQYGAQLHNFEVSDNILQLLPEVITALDQPIADSSAILTYFLSQQSAQTVTVVLSGAGADELFGGYNRHRAFYQYLHHRAWVSPLLPLLKQGTSWLPTGTNHPLRKQFRLLAKLAPGISTNPAETFLNFAAMSPQLQQLTKKNFEVQAPDKKGNENWLRWALNQDQQQYLVSDVLALTDKTSMRHSLEIRVPYLDNELTDLLQSVPAEMLFQRGRKWILRDLLRKRNGAAFADRSKEGFGLPLGDWLRKPSNAWILQPLQQPARLIFEYLDFTSTQLFLTQHLNGKADLSSEIWALVVLAHWLEKEFS
jgi:asparagine synthase (glutamine-hydrolysing)